MFGRFSLSGRVAVITGASRGIGLATAREFARAGAKLAIASRKQESLDAVAEELRALGAEVLPVACHAGKAEDIENLLQKTVAHFGQIDILINNAGTNPYFGPMIETEMGAWGKTFQINLEGYFLAARWVARHCIEHKRPGSIVNIASILGLRAAPFQGVYGATKAAIISMTQTLAQELGPHQIRVNAIAPGLVDTKLAGIITGSEELRTMVESRTPVGRIAQPEEISTGVLFLASDAGSFVTGHTLVMDGGSTITALAIG
jgi:NAD(P)-dependent dehydrogenase (short-subunit alcohol dehydrogenase family)